MSGAIRVTALAVFRRGVEIRVFEGWDREKGSAFARPPGGGVEFGERSEDAVRREMREELGIDLRTASLLGVIENVFDFEGVLGHQAMFVYETTATEPRFIDREEIWEEEERPDAHGETRFLLRWRRPDNESVRLVPEGLRELLEGHPAGPTDPPFR